MYCRKYGSLPAKILPLKQRLSCRSGAITGTIVLGECVMAHMHEGLATTSPHGKPIADIFKLKPMARLGGDMYSCLRDIVELPRPAKDMQFKTKTVAGKATPKTD